MKRLRGWVLCGLLLMPAVQAHEGETHGDGEPAAHAAGQPQHLPDGSLQISKPVQRLLGLRTQPLSRLRGLDTRHLVAVVEVPPESARQLPAPEAGQLEAAAGGWPLPGRALHRGETIAWLRPVLNTRERAERRAQLADLDQKLVISGLTVERMRLQASGAEDRASLGNVYFEQSQAEHEAMLAQRRLLLDSLEGRHALRAPADAVVMAVRAAPGEVVSAGQPVIELQPRGALRLVAISDAPPPQSPPLSPPQARLSKGGSALVYRGAEPLADAPGARLLFEVPAAAGLQPGQIVDIELQTETAGTLPDTACVRDAGGGAVVWEHVAAEHFRPHRLASCRAPAMIAAGGSEPRIVTEGAALLTQYR